MQAAVGPGFSLSDPCSQRVPVVAFSFCLDHGVISLSERRSWRGILSPAIMLRHEGKAERIFGRFPIRLDGRMIFSEVVAGSGSTPLEALADLPLILTMRPNSPRLTIENGMGLHGLQPNIRLEANTLPLMTDLVIAGLGYMVLPMCGVRGLLKQGAVSASPIAELSITWLVARPKTHTLGVAAERFCEMLYEFGRKQVRDGVWQDAAP
jgi:LysR family nitrogen assimilation transcriptional regulator